MDDAEHHWEVRELQQWLRVADDWLGEEFLREEIDNLLKAKQLIDNRLANLKNMLNDIQSRRKRLKQLTSPAPHTTGDE